MKNTQVQHCGPSEWLTHGHGRGTQLSFGYSPFQVWQKSLQWITKPCTMRPHQGMPRAGSKFVPFALYVSNTILHT